MAKSKEPIEHADLPMGTLENDIDANGPTVRWPTGQSALPASTLPGTLLKINSRLALVTGQR